MLHPYMVVVLVLVFLRTSQTMVPWSRPCPVMCRCGYEDGMQLRVDCVDVGLTDVPLSLSILTSTLDLSMNQLSVLPAGAFNRLQNLKELRLAGNSLQQIHSEAFSGLYKLTALTLHNTDLSTVPSEALGKLTNLQSLHLDANLLSRVPASSFMSLSALRLLWLEDNHLQDVPGAALRDLPRLQALTLGLNRLTHLPDRAFSSLRELRLLQLHHNQIYSLSPMCFYGLHKLHTLDLSFNRLCHVPTAIRFLPGLKEINLSNNPLLVVGDLTFTKLSKPLTFGCSLVSLTKAIQTPLQTNHKNNRPCQIQDSKAVFLFILVVFLTALIFKARTRK